MASAPRPIKRSTPVRCALCGFVFPGGWFRLPVTKRPNGAMLLHHLSAMHPEELRRYLARMRTEDIATVAAECYEVVEGDG